MLDDARLLEETLIDLINSRATGVLEVHEEKKRWQFFFDAGELCATRSNLKSEQDEAVARELGDVSEDVLHQVLAGRRLTHAMRSDNATLTFKAGSAPSRRNPANLRRALFEGLRDARDEEDLRERLEPILSAMPVALESDFSELTGTILDSYLYALDGCRPGQDVINFAPVEPKSMLAALWVGWQIGVIGVDEDPTNISVIAPPPAPRPAPPAATPPPAASPPPPAPRPASPASPPPTDGPAPVVHEAALPRRSPLATPSPAAPAAPTAAESPADRLRAMAEQLRAAQNHFELLSVGWDQPAEALRAAYMRLARDLHPDRYVGATAADQELATELFDRVRAAWEELADEAKRKAYIDRVIHGQKTEDELAMEQVQRYLSAEADFKRGMAAFNNGQTNAAMPHFASAVEKAPDELEFIAFHGYTVFSVNQKKDPARAREGLAMLEDAIKRNAAQERKRDTLHVLMARAWREKGELNLAKRSIREALKINPNSTEASRVLRRIQDEEAQPTTDDSVLGRVSGFFEGLFKKKDAPRR